MIGATRSGLKSAQQPAELEWLLDLFRQEKVRRYLEIGALYGDTFWEVATRLPENGRAVAIDLPAAGWGKSGARQHLERAVRDLRDTGRDARLILGDSTNEEIIRQAASYGPYDAVLIDGDHTLAGCWRDWQTYGPMARIVAFHDIAWVRPGPVKKNKIEVPAVWDRIKGKYRTKEMIVKPGDCGIGVVFHG